LIDYDNNSSSEPFQRFAASFGGLLFVGHGTRNPTGVQQLLDLVNQCAAIEPLIPIEASFLELAEPTIAEGITRLTARGIKQFIAVPILLFRAGHADSDIPQAIEAAVENLDVQWLSQTPPLDLHPLLLELSQARMEQALSQQSDLQQLGEPSIGLVMIGRGASHAPAVDRMKELTRLRAESSQVVWNTTGFFAAAQPTVTEALESAAQSSCDVICVQPHLLFEGELTNQLREKVREYQDRHPEKRWFLTEPLGADPLLARVFLSLAAAKVREWFNNSC
jgi:sirohydrochlorin ferrochelatase